jgi:hypothetical protein
MANGGSRSSGENGWDADRRKSSRCDVGISQNHDSKKTLPISRNCRDPEGTQTKCQDSVVAQVIPGSLFNGDLVDIKKRGSWISPGSIGGYPYPHLPQ